VRAVLIILCVLVLFGGVGSAPVYGYSRGWGWYPSGGLVGLLLVILFVWYLLTREPLP
jgi:hypothetical protein